jgi:hypothetical protein
MAEGHRLTVELHVGADDGEARKRLKRALRKAGARRVGSWWGLGGSQEISSATFRIGGGRLTIEAETYIGLTVAGDEEAVAALERHLRR